MARMMPGLGGVLERPDDPSPGGFSRDSLAFDVVNVVADMLFDDEYMVRDIIQPQWSIDYPLEDEVAALPELVFATRADNSAGPLEPAASAAILAKLAGARQVELDETVATILAPIRPALILPAPCLMTKLELGADHPLDGVVVCSVLDVLERIALTGAASELVFPEPARRMLEVCRDERLVVGLR